MISYQLPAGTQSHICRVEDYSVHYLERGKGIPVFMMHGNPSWSFLYRKIMGALDTNRYRCIAPDLVGLGFSSKPRKSSFHTLDNHQRIISKFLEKLIDQDFIFVGQDWGGPIGLLASMHHTQQLKGMVVLNTSFRPPRAGFKPTAFHKFSRIPLVSDVVFRLFQFPQAYLHTAQGNSRSISGLVKKAYTYPLRKISQNMAPLMLARMVPHHLDHPSVNFLKQTEAYAAAFEGPVSLVWGKNDPILGGLLSAHQRLMPKARVQLTEGGHFIQEEFPELIAAEIDIVRKEAFDR
ncbi:MAG: alpha/beta fold hydrolase [Cyclobacteriaceae bacterium]